MLVPGRRGKMRDFLVQISHRYMEKYIDKTIPRHSLARRTSDRCLLSLTDRVQSALDNEEPIETGGIFIGIQKSRLRSV